MGLYLLSVAFWLIALVIAGPTVLILFYLLTGRALPAWAKARTVWGALKAAYRSENAAADLATRTNFDSASFLQEAKRLFQQLQMRGKSDATDAWKDHLTDALLQGSVDALKADFLGLDMDGDQLSASVRFTGRINNGADSIPFVQLWDFSRPVSGERWVVADIDTLDAVAATAVTGPSGTIAYRLARTSPRRHQAWRSLALGLLAGAVGFALLKDAVLGHEVQSLTDVFEDALWMEYLFGAVFGVLGLIGLWGAAKLLLSGATPETIVEVMPLRFARGAQVRMTFRQPGPLSLQSLRANLVGMETWRESNDKGARHLGTHALLDTGPLEILQHIPFETTVRLRVPRDLVASGPTTKGHQVEWVIEVYGKVTRGANFTHAYRVQIA